MPMTSLRIWRRRSNTKPLEKTLAEWRTIRRSSETSWHARLPVCSGRQIVVGLVNNMLGSAHEKTERQFRQLLSLAAGDLTIRLRLFSNTADGCLYESIHRLESTPLDALIVTGAPPAANHLTAEPFWCDLSRIVEIAQERALPTIWSCLAAHTAVFKLDGVHRRRLAKKLSGLYECWTTEPRHPLMANLPAHWRAPHSRCNELPSEWLESAGYQVVAASPQAGADIFVKDLRALFLFCQGHPEYDRETLLIEYKRDIRNFLSRKRDDYPEVPENYFDQSAQDQLTSFRHLALSRRTPELVEQFPPVTPVVYDASSRSSPAVQIYANWLRFAAGQSRPGFADKTYCLARRS
jgi:homoserine O-succinyltransferase/O-acetyltransferase